MQARAADDSMAWLVDDDDDPDIVILSSSPAVIKNDGADKIVGVAGSKSGEQYENNNNEYIVTFYSFGSRRVRVIIART